MPTLVNSKSMKAPFKIVSLWSNPFGTKNVLCTTEFSNQERLRLIFKCYDKESAIFMLTVIDKSAFMAVGSKHDWNVPVASLGSNLRWAV